MAPNVVRHSDLMKFREYYNLSDAHIIMFNSIKKNKQVLSAAHCFRVSDIHMLGMHKINLGTGEKLLSFAPLSTSPLLSL